MINFGFLAARSMMDGAMKNLVRDQVSDNFTDREKKIVESLENQLPTSERSSSKKCPECNEFFHIVHLDKVEIDCCKKCESLWFDPNELRMVMKTPEDIEDQFLHAGKSKYNCPTCHTAMRKRSLLFPERLVVDICPKDHGVYFEKGELEQLFKSRKW